ncbi:MAG: tetratricopeptide repeat protein [Deltaproteobacteria bacterium]|nr:tetratricopeptide repeat protein [Deltaproteobacteria bacterium]
MNALLPQTYLLGLIGLLAIVAFVGGRQFLRVRRDEQSLLKMEQEKVASSKDAGALYELASVQLRKRLYSQAIVTLRQAVKRLNDEPDEARALIENALGYALAAEKDFTTAVRHYKAALRAKEDYPVAINNLAYAQERLLDNEEACALYRQTLVLDPKNKTARKRLNRLERAASKVKSSNQASPKGPDGRGF